MPFLPSQIPLAPLLGLGSEAQASSVLETGDLGSALLMIEHHYGGLSFEDYFEVSTRLNQLKGLFQSCMNDMSGPLPTMQALSNFFEKTKFHLVDPGHYPPLLSEFFMHRAKKVVPSQSSPALYAAAAHLAATRHVDVVIGKTPEGNRGLYSSKEGLLLTFSPEGPELVITPEMPRSESLLLIVSDYFRALARACEDEDMAQRLSVAATAVYSPAETPETV